MLKLNNSGITEDLKWFISESKQNDTGNSLTAELLVNISNEQQKRKNSL
jgi:hypothetical protein